MVRSLRLRVTVLASLATLVLMAAAGAALVAYQRNQLFATVDAALDETVTEVEQTLDVTFGRRFQPVRNRLPPLQDVVFVVAASPRTLQLLDADGSVVVSSGDFTGLGPVVDAAAILADDGAAIDDTVDTGDVRYRVAFAVVDPANPKLLVAGTSLLDVDESLRSQRRGLFVGVPALSAIIGGLIWVVLGRALTPMEAIRREAAEIGSEDLSRRVPVPDASVELERLAETLNDMLARLDRSAEQQRRFVADASHELRSPLAGLRSQLEVNLAHPETADLVDSEEAMLAETIRMQNLVEDLLVLARTARPDARVPSTPVDLDDIVLAEAVRIHSGGVAVDTAGVSGAQVAGDRGQLERVVRNLADNAARHARSKVGFSLRETGRVVEMVVVDDGPGVPVAEAEAIFDRFTRLSEARDRDSGGSGLGLAICREIVERHGGSVSLDTAHTAGARFVVRLPLPPSAGG